MSEKIRQLRKEILFPIINFYTSAKFGEINFTEKIDLSHKTLLELRKKLIAEIEVDEIDNYEKLLLFVDEDSNLFKLAQFEFTKTQSEIYNELLTSVNGEQASKLSEEASERTREALDNLIEAVREEAKILYLEEYFT